MPLHCANCERTFETERTDTVFCSDKCRAQYFRDVGSTGKHEHLHRENTRACEWCGKAFQFNAYAKRKGQREPSYCSNKCRQAAWRARNASKRQANQRAKENPRGWDSFRAEFERQKAERSKQQQQADTGDFRDRLKIPRRWTTPDAMLWIFGSEKVRPEADVSKECRALNKKYHPDGNSGKPYKHLPTINAAWDFLKRNYKAQRS